MTSLDDIARELGEIQARMEHAQKQRDDISTRLTGVETKVSALTSRLDKADAIVTASKGILAVVGSAALGFVSGVGAFVYWILNRGT